MKGKISKALLFVLILALAVPGGVFAAENAEGQTIRLAGRITQVGSNGFSLHARNGYDFQLMVDEETQFHSKDGSIRSLEDLRAGMVALVIAYKTDSDEYMAKVIAAAEAGTVLHDRLKVSGEIVSVALDQETFSLETKEGDRLSFLVSDRTRFISLDDSIQGLADLEPGMLARVVAVEQEDGTLLAWMVAAGGEEDIRERLLEARGEIAQVAPESSTFTLNTSEGQLLSFDVNELTRFRSPRGSIQGIGDLEEGMLAAVRAFEREDGSLLALLVLAGTEDDLRDHLINARGHIRKVVPGDSTFWLETQEGERISFEVTARTQFRSLDGSIHGIDDLEEGMIAAVTGYEKADGTRLAMRIMAAREDDLKEALIRAGGEIARVIPGESTFWLMTGDGRLLEFTVVGRTRFRSLNGSVEDIYDLEKGMMARVAAFEKADGSRIALMVAVAQPGETGSPGRVGSQEINSPEAASGTGIPAPDFSH